MVRSATESNVEHDPRLTERLELAWKRSDELFDLVRESSIRERPVELQHPVIFYLGHFPASAWSHFGRAALEHDSPRPEFDELFEDAPDRARAMGPGDWPSIHEIRGYRDGIRSAFRSEAERLQIGEEARVLHQLLEHELSHHETLLNLLQELDLSHKRRPGWWSPPLKGPARVAPSFVKLEGPHGAFELGATPVTVEEFEAFVDDDGYENSAFWTAEDWMRREERGLVLPKDWMVRNGRRYVRTMFDRIPLDEVAGWPVSVSAGEARAFARWSGARLPKAEELTSVAESLVRRDFPCAGNFGFRHSSPTPVGSFPEGASANGVHELFGNGWDLATRDQRTALFGGSWATDARLIEAGSTDGPWIREDEAEAPAPFTQFRLARGPR